MDRSICNIPRHTEQRQFQRSVSPNEPLHSSFDLDGDGCVGTADYREAKQLDRQGCGVLDTTRRRNGRMQLARSALEHRKEVNSLQQQRVGEATLSNLSGAMADLPQEVFGKHLRQARLKQAKEMNEGSSRIIRCFMDTKALNQSHQTHPPRYRTRSEMLDARALAAKGSVGQCIEDARTRSMGAEAHMQELIKHRQRRSHWMMG